ncbi:4780_t:CDS:2, partial [Paraglomus occultum]
GSHAEKLFDTTSGLPETSPPVESIIDIMIDDDDDTTELITHPLSTIITEQESLLSLTNVELYRMGEKPTKKAGVGE